VVEGGAELVELLLRDALAVPGQDLVLNLVDGSAGRRVMRIIITANYIIL
jgi:hypothetical protein